VANSIIPYIPIDLGSFYSHDCSLIEVELFAFLQDVLDSLEFARGSADSTWGSVRAAMGHPEPFPVKYVAIGNEDCGKKFYRGKIFNYICIVSLVEFFLEYP